MPDPSTPEDSEARRRFAPVEVTAHHEAGHAVMAFLLDRPVHDISIVREKGSLGRVTMAAPRRIRPDLFVDGPTRTRLESRIMVAYGGVAAEYLLTKQRRWSGSRSDFEDVTTLLGYLTPDPDECGPYSQLLWIRTVRLLRNNRGAVQAIASELLSRHRLLGDEAKQLFLATRGGPRPPALPP